jgi:NTE family protein
MESLSYYASPYQTNPLNYNPFKDLLAGMIDFERVRRQTALKLFLCATNVQTAKVKIFTGEELRLEHLLAATCLPLMMHAVEVDGEYYWDGSFVGNPAIFPLLYHCATRDILMVHITPAERPGVPTTSPSIMNRMQEISFNTSLIREMRTIAYLNRLIDDGTIGEAKDGSTRVHVIEAEDLIRELSWSSRLNGDRRFLEHLFAVGRERADAWLKANFERIGLESTIDLYTKYF